MKCPACAHEISTPEEVCSICNFHLEELRDKAVGLPPEKPTTDVYDPGRLLCRVGLARILDRFDDFEARTHGEFRLVILPSVKPLTGAEAIFWLFNRWDLGGEQKRAILLLLATEDRRIQCEVGYGFEHALSGGEVGKILDFHAVPLLRKGAADDALFHTVDLLAQLIEAAPDAPRSNP
jgi:uncharacterized membrane protein YgcG